MFKTHNHPLNLLRHIGKFAKKTFNISFICYYRTPVSKV